MLNKQLRIMENNMYMLLENSTVALEFFKRKTKKEPKKYTLAEVKKIVSEVRSEIQKIMKEYDLKNPRMLGDVDTFGNYIKDQKEFKSYDDFPIFRADIVNAKEDDLIFNNFFGEVYKALKLKEKNYELDIEFQKENSTIYITLD